MGSLANLPLGSPVLTTLIQKEETLENGDTCTIGFPWTIATNRLVSKIKKI